ncbi:MAG: dephospho-CoA kinase [Hyphomicrobiaceae bacterium]|nr:dephospho-CoA kinase [Hyphomicrobiaceae bacterium]
MLLIGLTGSIGMGKSTVALRLKALGLAVIDADAEVHKLYNGGAAAPLIEAAFPGTTSAGRVDRQKLAQWLLAHPDDFKRLEAIVHPLVFKAEQALLRAEAERGAEMAVLEVPLLFETKGHERVDVTMVVSAPPEMQWARVLARPGMTAEKLAQILAKQMSDADKRAMADYVVDTGVSIEETGVQVDKIIESLRGRKGTAYARYWA